jgi:hypothetical protein
MESLVELADKLGVAAEQLIAIYSELALLQWVDVWVALGLAVLFGSVGGMCGIFAKVHRNNENAAAPLTVVSAIFGIAVFIATIIACVEAGEAYLAAQAPEAWAIQQILDQIGGN